MPLRLILLLTLLLPLSAQLPPAIRTAPVWTGSFGKNDHRYSFVSAGHSPEAGGSTIIPTLLLPVTLHFASGAVLSPSARLPEVQDSPIFKPFPFTTGTTQFGDALLRSEFFDAAQRTGWHTLLGAPQVAPELTIEIAAADGYALRSNGGKILGIVDRDVIQRAILDQVAALHPAPGTLAMAVTLNTAFYALSDATVCCSVGMHGSQVNTTKTAAQAFVVGSYFDQEVMPRYRDLQGISQQLGEWLNDPLAGYQPNKFFRWRNPVAEGGCAGSGVATDYLLEQPTDSRSAGSWQLLFNNHQVHLENVALYSWFAGSPAALGSLPGAYSFPDISALPRAAEPCSQDRAAAPAGQMMPPLPHTERPNGHSLIGYWEGYADARTNPLHQTSPQWDTIIATFAAPVKGSTSRLHFQPPPGISDADFKADVSELKRQGKHVLISIGGGGEVVTLNTPQDVQLFVSSVIEIVTRYGFEGIDLDIETPSILIQPGDTDFRHPTTPSIVNLIRAVREIHDHFGPKFLLAEVPEAAQAQAGLVAYGGQFGCFLPVIYGTRDILTFVDTQDYNTPPLEGLDGNYYFPGNADYHVAMSELLVHGFTVNGIPFPALPPEQVAIGLPATPHSARNYTEPPAIENALTTLLSGKPYPGARYQLRNPSGYPRFLGAMFWAINEDLENHYRMSNVIGPFLHRLPQP